MLMPERPSLAPLEGGLTAVPGLRCLSTATGVKQPPALDLGVLVADSPRSVAGVFTQNQAAAAPVRLCRETLARHDAVRVVVVNSGNANALTGAQGYQDAQAVCVAAQRLFGGPVLPLSTGVIGVPLPREQILKGLQACQDEPGPPGGFAQAILTTDTCVKESACRCELGDGVTATVGGVAKGSGMIHPNMATMLAILATDVPVAPRALDGLLRRVTDQSFNGISVDGDTSTNDAVLALSGGQDLEPLAAGDPRLEPLEAAFLQVARALANKIVEDGEGATKVLEITVSGTRWPGEAREVARAIAVSPLVKTALHGGDANWGRIISAAGNANVPFDVSRIELAIGGVVVFRDGLPQLDAQDRAEQAFRADRVRLELQLGAGDEAATVLTSDFSAEYVAINAHYRT